MEMTQSGLRRKLRDKVRNDQEMNMEDVHELPLLSFSFSNKLGEGGFGPVYKVYIRLYYIADWFIG